MSVTVHRTMYRSSTSLLLRPLQQRPLQHALKHVERPGGSHEGVGRKKNNLATGQMTFTPPPMPFLDQLALETTLRRLTRSVNPMS